MPKLTDIEKAERLAARAAELTTEMDRDRAALASKAKRRLRIWEKCAALGLSRTRMGKIAGLHHSQVDKAFRRNGG